MWYVLLVKENILYERVYMERVQKEISNGEIETIRGLNQEISLVRVGDTRWTHIIKQ